MIHLTLTDVETYRSQGAGQRSGKYLRFYCPIHGSDSQRSFQYNPETGHWKCHQCGEYGYIREHYGRGDGYTVKHCVSPSSAKQEIEPVRSDLDELLKKYQDALPGSLGESYLKKRGLSLELALKYDVGYAAQGEWAGKRKNVRDWKYGGIVFPHCDSSGNMVNLYCRLVGEYEEIPEGIRDEWKKAKHDHLAGNKGVFNAQALSRGTVFLCEGVFDALSLIATGYENTCAIFGNTGLQGRWSWVKAGRLIFCFDNDPAGEKWKQLADEAILHGKEVYYLEKAAFQNCKDLNEVWIKTGRIDVGELPAEEREEGTGESGAMLEDPSSLHEAAGEAADLGINLAEPFLCHMLKLKDEYERAIAEGKTDEDYQGFLEEVESILQPNDGYFCPKPRKVR